MKRVISALLALSFVLTFTLSVGAMSPAPSRPLGQQGSYIAIPFPLQEVPVHITKTDFSFVPETETVTYFGYYGRLPYNALKATATYTLEYTGEEGVSVDVILPIYGQNNMSIMPEFFVDQEPGKLSQYLPLEEHWNYPQQEVSMEDVVTDLREQQEPYQMASFPLDETALLYTIRQLGTTETNIGFEITMGYDPSKTMLLMDTPFSFEEGPHYDSKLLPNAKKEYYTINFEAPEFLDVLVIGEDTLEWEMCLQQHPEESSRKNLSVSPPQEITPREFIDKSLFRHEELWETFSFPVANKEAFYIRWIDSMYLGRRETSRTLASPPETLVNLGELDRGLSNGATTYLYDQEIIGVSVDFQPHETKTLRIDYPPEAGISWHEEQEEYETYYYIFTQGAKYWDSFGDFSVEVTHPENMLRAEIPEDFITKENASTYSTSTAPKKDLKFSFWMEDTWVKPRTNWLLLMYFLLALAGIYWPVTILIVVLLFYLVRRIVRRSKNRKESSGDQ